MSAIETKAYEVLTKTSDTLDEANQTLKDTKHASKEILEQAQIIKNNNKRNIGIAMFIVAVVAIAIGFFVYTNWVQISGQLTGEYKSCCRKCGYSFRGYHRGFRTQL